MNDIPRHLREQLRRGSVIPFVGAGVSRAVIHKESKLPLFPDWNKLLEDIWKELIDQKKNAEARRFRELLTHDPPDYFGAAEIAWDNLKVPDCQNVLIEKFDLSIDDARQGSIELARSIWNIGDLIFTTNFDPVMKWACPKPGDLRIICRQVHELTQILRNTGSKRYTIWHLHGNILEDVDNIIFTRTQYDEFYYNKNHESAYNALRTFLSTKTLLFVGFSLNDVYFRKNLEDVNRIFEGAANSFYVLVRRGTKIDASLRNIVIPIEFDNYEVGLPRLIRQMGDITRPQRRSFGQYLRQSGLAAFILTAALSSFYSRGISVRPAPDIAAELPIPSQTENNSGTQKEAPVQSAAAEDSEQTKKNPINKKTGKLKPEKIFQKGRAVPGSTESELINRAHKASGSTIDPSK